MSCLKTVDPIDMPFAGLTHVGPRNHINGDQDRTNPFAAAKGDKTAMRPLVKLIWTHDDNINHDLRLLHCIISTKHVLFVHSLSTIYYIVMSTSVCGGV